MLFDRTEEKRCTRHPMRKADSFCHRCKRHFCIDCLIEAEGYYYCGDPECGGSGRELAATAAAETNQKHAELFCPECISTTETEIARSTFTLNGCGTMLYGSGRKCPKCGSEESSAWWCLFFIPILRDGRYRVRWFGSGRYIGRKIKAEVLEKHA